MAGNSNSRLENSLQDSVNKQNPDWAKQLYNEMSDTYDTLLPEEWGYTAYKEAVALLCKHADPSKLGDVADIGCGTGLVGLELVKSGFNSQLDGYDISSEMLIKAAKKTSNGRNVYTKTIQTDLTKAIPEADGRYDALLCIGTLTYFVNVIDKVLAEFQRIVKPGGLGE